MAEILTFPAAASRKTRRKPRKSLARKWADQHLPLIEAAMDLVRATDVEFRKRCRTIAQTEGASVLEQMVVQLDRLAAHISGVVSALTMTARRIRKVMAEGLEA